MGKDLTCVVAGFGGQGSLFAGQGHRYGRPH